MFDTSSYHAIAGKYNRTNSGLNQRKERKMSGTILGRVGGSFRGGLVRPAPGIGVVANG